MKIKLAALLGALILASVSLPAALLMPRQLGVQGKAAGLSAGASDSGYVLRELNGKIAVYSAGSTSPLTVLNVYTDTLPQSEQQKLRSGVRVRTQQELLALEENYTS